jgi:hypothetical protein
MKRTLKIVLASAGLALALTACGAPATSSQPAANATSSQPAADAAPAPGGGGQSMRRPGVMGQITAISGGSLTVQGQQGTTTVTLTDSTQVVKQASLDLASVPVGATIIAMGAQDGASFTAQQIRIGTADASAAGQGGNGPGGGPPPSDGTAQPAPPGASQLQGTVASVADNTISVTAADGSSITVSLASGGQITQQAAGSAADLTVGAWVMAQGEQADTALTATRVEVVPAMSQ